MANRDFKAQEAHRLNRIPKVHTPRASGLLMEWLILVFCLIPFSICLPASPSPLPPSQVRTAPSDKTHPSPKPLASSSKSKPVKPKVTKPNVVFILTDDLGINDLHCYGRSDHRTPRLDRLASEGVRFTSAYCAQPICSASRAALLTGKSPARLHLTTFLPGRDNNPAQPLLHPPIAKQLPLEEVTFAEHFKQAGYKTAFFGKWHLGNVGFNPTDQGFDIYEPGSAVTPTSLKEGGKGEYGLTALAERFLADHKNEPFLLFVSHNSPHIPYTAKPAFVGRNANAFEPVYAGLIETLDDAVGRLLAQIDSLGLRDRTLVIFTSDNGGLHVPELNHIRVTHNTPFRAGKGFLYEGGLRIPLIARWPGKIPANKVIDTPVVNTAWLPTLLELVNLPPPPKSTTLDTTSFARVLTGKSTKPEPRLFWHFPHYTNQGSRPSGAVREGDWKCIQNYEDGKLELYNLAADPGEQYDLYATNPARAQKLAASLSDWKIKVSAQSNTTNTAFSPKHHQVLYELIDVSRFDPLHASRQDFSRLTSWRKEMDEAARRPLAQ